MRAALMNEFSQAGKNALIVRALEKSAAKYHVAVSYTHLTLPTKA